jgi:hypothetical protein
MSVLVPGGGKGGVFKTKCRHIMHCTLHVCYRFSSIGSAEVIINLEVLQKNSFLYRIDKLRNRIKKYNYFSLDYIIK